MTWTVCINIFGKKLEAFYANVQVKCKGYKNWRFRPTSHSLYFENGTRYGRSYNGRRTETRMRATD